MFLAILIAVALIAVALIAVAFVLAALYLIYRWGPSVTHRAVNCPEKKVLAMIQVERKEGLFGALLEPDVTSCSLMPAGRVDCEKKCLC